MSNLVKVALFLLLIVQPALAVAIFFFFPKDQTVGILAFVPSWFIFVGHILYKYWDRAYLAVEGKRLWLLGAGASWSAEAQWDLAAVDAGLVTKTVKAIQVAEKSELLGEEPLRRVLQVGPYVVVIRAVNGLREEAGLPEPPSGTAAALIVQIRESNMPFRRAVQAATQFAPNLFETIQRAVSTPSESQSYSSVLRFPEGNPYYGFFLRDLQLKRIDRFIVELTVPIPGDADGAKVSASKNHLTIVATKSSTLASVSKQYLELTAA